MSFEGCCYFYIIWIYIIAMIIKSNKDNVEAQMERRYRYVK